MSVYSKETVSINRHFKNLVQKFPKRPWHFPFVNREFNCNENVTKSWNCKLIQRQAEQNCELNTYCKKFQSKVWYHKVTWSLKSILQVNRICAFWRILRLGNIWNNFCYAINRIWMSYILRTLDHVMINNGYTIDMMTSFRFGHSRV